MTGLRELAPYLARNAYRVLHQMFASSWRQARDQVANQAPDSLNAAIWPSYYRLLRACQEVLDHAPMHPREAQTVNVQRRYERSLEQLATALSKDFPRGFLELESYIVSDQVAGRRRSRGLTRYRNQRKRYRRRGRNGGRHA